MKMELSVEYCFEGIMEYRSLYGDYNTIKKFEEKVIKLGIPKLSFLFMKNIEGSNKKAHTKIILTSNDLKLLYNTALIKGVNTVEISKKIIDSKNVYYNYLFAKDIKEANVEAHENVIIENDKGLFKYYFAKDVFGSNKRRLGESILKNDPNINFHFAKDINDGLYLEHLEVVKQNKDLYNLLIKIKNIENEEELEKQRTKMCKDARRVLRRLEYVVE